jgi:hypothetical protein
MPLNIRKKVSPTPASNLLCTTPMTDADSEIMALGEIEWVKPLRRGRFPGQILGIM